MTWRDVATTRVTAYLNNVATDITAYTLGTSGRNINSSRGRQTELSQMDPSRMSLVLNNRDGRFTPGNTSSPYYPYWRQAIRIVWSETIGARTFTHFDGFLEIPEMQLDFQGADPTVNNATLTLSATDTLTRLGRARPFASTLAAHIEASGGDALVFYAPCNDVPLITDRITGRRLQPTVATSTTYLYGSTIESTSGALAPADDIASVATALESVGAGAQNGRVLTYSGVSSPAVAAGDVVTVVGWFKPTQTANANFTTLTPHLFTVQLNESTPTASGFLRVRSASGVWKADYLLGGVTGTVVGRNVSYDEPIMVGVQYGFNPASLELWLGDDRYVGAPSGSPPASAVVASVAPLEALAQTRGSVSHFQVYVGTSAEWGYAEYQAQREVAMRGLERQSTGERIRTVMGYAGISDSAMDRVDAGSSVMSAASLAGQTPLAALQEAADTERGRLFSAGDGSVVFHDRHRIYDV